MIAASAGLRGLRCREWAIDGSRIAPMGNTEMQYKNGLLSEAEELLLTFSIVGLKEDVEVEVDSRREVSAKSLTRAVT